ncbi:MAG: hypothetical protein J6I45_09090 [Clostridia bacterium]|nr:hypothetical protein [Clostridia bacterium]
MKKSLKIIVALTLIVSMLALNASAMTVAWTSEKVGGGTNAAQVQQTTFDPVDVSAYDTVHVWVYIDDPALISPTAGNPSFELSSAGKCDNSEIAWNLLGYDWKAGWNELWLPVSEGAYSDGSTGRIDMTAVNFSRFYLFTAGDGQATIKVDGIEFTNGKIIDGAFKLDLTGATAFGPEGYIEGNAVKDGVTVHYGTTFETPFDISAFAGQYVKFAIWSSADVSFSQTNFEFTSSGKSDVEELAFEIKELKAGWNEIILPVPADSAADLSKINFIRYYTINNGDATLKVASVDFGTAADFGILGDYTALDAAIKAAEAKVALDAARDVKYSYATKTAYDAALAAAKNLSREITEDEQAKIDDAAKALNDAVAALKAGVSPWMYVVVYSLDGVNLPVLNGLTTGTIAGLTTNPYFWGN